MPHIPPLNLKCLLNLKCFTPPSTQRYEVQRLFWQGKLGNLILLPFEEAGAGAVASADYEAKAEFYRQVSPGNERLVKGGGFI